MIFTPDTTTAAEDNLAAAERAENHWLTALARAGEAASRTDDALEALDLLNLTAQHPDQDAAHEQLHIAYAAIRSAIKTAEPALAAAQARSEDARRAVAAEQAAAAVASL